MTLLAIPNISAGRDKSLVVTATAAVESTGARLLDIHIDSVHNRSVLTVIAPSGVLVVAMTELAKACTSIDLRDHTGVHPRLGVLDVCPIVPHGSPMEDAIACALETAEKIGEEAGLPVFLYGEAAERSHFRSLPELRRLGTSELARLRPDRGPAAIDPARGVVCVGARGVLIAFNVWFRCPIRDAEAIASAVRESSGGLPGVRALGMSIDETLSQVSMNLVDPPTTGVDDVFDAVSKLARERGIETWGTEIVGLPPARFMPDPEREAARLLLKPGRSLESAIDN